MTVFSQVHFGFPAKACAELHSLKLAVARTISGNAKQENYRSTDRPDWLFEFPEKAKNFFPNLVTLAFQLDDKPTLHRNGFHSMPKRALAFAVVCLASSSRVR